MYRVFDSPGEPPEGTRPQNILEAVLQNNILVLRKMVSERKASVNDCDEVGWTALHYAAMYDRRDALLVLVEAGADVEAKDKNRCLSSLICVLAV